MFLVLKLISFFFFSLLVSKAFTHSPIYMTDTSLTNYTSSCNSNQCRPSRCVTNVTDRHQT